MEDWLSEDVGQTLAGLAVDEGWETYNSNKELGEDATRQQSNFVGVLVEGFGSELDLGVFPTAGVACIGDEWSGAGVRDLHV